MEIMRNPTVDVVCDEGDLELGEDPVPQTTVACCLKRIGGKPITYDNAFPLSYWVFLLEIQVKYIEHIVITRNTKNLGMSRKEVIQVISDIGQASYYLQAYKHLDSLIKEKWLPSLKRSGWVMQSQATTTE